MHDACNQKTRGVSEKVPFASFDLLGGIEPARTSSLGGFNRLAVDHSCGGTGLSAVPRGGFCRGSIAYVGGQLAVM
jgi:hypothetical protein